MGPVHGHLRATRAACAFRLEAGPSRVRRDDRSVTGSRLFNLSQAWSQESKYLLTHMSQLSEFEYPILTLVTTVPK